MNCVNPLEVWPNNKRQIVPCGKCLACLSNKRRDWIFRLQKEHRASKGALFITLTYHPKYCPDQLEKKHLQLFMKRLRKRENDKIRFYAVGEYGSNTGRPHYHVLLFNCDLSGETIRKSWRSKDGDDIGHVHIGRVSEASIAYCTKYVVQPISDLKGKQKPFALMSRGYGLGLSYLSDAIVEWHRKGDRNYTIVNGVECRLPRYYKEKIWYREEDKKRISDISKWKAIKRSRENLRIFVKEFGAENAKEKMAEMRNAALAQIKSKVAFTQIL